MNCIRFCVLALLCGACGDKATDTAVLDGNFTTEAESDGGSYWVTYQTDPEAIPFNDYFNMVITVFDGSDKTTVLTDIDGMEINLTMPDHGHGMNVTPVVSSNGDGTFTVDPLLFHMSGHWLVDLAISRTGTSELAQFDIDCCVD